jgi:hypothetical protein
MLFQNCNPNVSHSPWTDPVANFHIEGGIPKSETCGIAMRRHTITILIVCLIEFCAIGFVRAAKLARTANGQ